MVMKTGKRNEAVEELTVEIKQGVIPRTDEYKYLGNMVNEQGDIETQLEAMEKKIGGIVRERQIFWGDMKLLGTWRLASNSCCTKKQLRKLFSTTWKHGRI